MYFCSEFKNEREMKKMILMLMSMFLLSTPMMAQVDNNPPQGQRPPMGMPPGGMPPGGPGSHNKKVTYSGAKNIKSKATETGKSYKSNKTDECALLISTADAVTINQSPQ